MYCALTPPSRRTPRCTRQPSSSDASGASARSVSNRTSVLSELPLAWLNCDTLAPRVAYQNTVCDACDTVNGPNIAAA